MKVNAPPCEANAGDRDRTTQGGPIAQYAYSLNTGSTLCRQSP